VSEQLNEPHGFDVLNDVLTTLRFRGSIFFRSQLAAPWGISLHETGFPRFHIALSGTCFVGSEEHAAVEVMQKDIVMLPTGNAHWIADRPGRKLVSENDTGEACQLGNPLFQNGEITNQIMCGIVNYDQHGAHPILDALPEVIHFPMLKPDEPIWMTVALMNAEIERLQRQDDPIIDRLTEVLFLQLLYKFASNNGAACGFLAALQDRRLHQALTLIHRSPEFAWSLEELGNRVGMSRATLVRHFESSIGIAPMTYIRNWRLLKAHNQIKTSITPIEQVAHTVGFSSAASLNKAFVRFYHCTPSELRRKS
jgi:AraC-like DNA-binding protein